MKLSNTDIQWLAGILEGEGYFTYQASRRLAVIALLMCDRDVVERAATIMGARSVGRTKHSEYNPAWRTAYRTQICGHRAVGWMMILYSLLGERRQKQIRSALIGWKSVRPGHVVVRAAAALLLSILATVSSAAFLPPEVASVKAAAQAARLVGHAESQLAVAIGKGGDPQKQAEAAAALIRVSRDMGGVLHGLLGGIPARADGSLLSREVQLQQVWVYRGGALAESLETAANALRAAGLDDYSLREAISTLSRVDPTLAYADPTPQALLPFQTIPAVIGPHGDYFAAQKHLFLATHYWREFSSEWLKVFARMPKEDAAAFAESFGIYARGVDFQIRTAVLIAGVAIGENDTRTSRLETLDAICRVSVAGEWLWVGPDKEGAPQFYKAAILAWARIDPIAARQPKAVSPAYRRASEMLGDSWFHSDQAIGGIFAFRNEPMRTVCAP